MRLLILHGIIGLVMIWHLSDASPMSGSVDENDEDEMEEETKKLVTIDAGYSLPSDGTGSVIYLFSGDQVQKIKARKGQTVMDKSELSIPRDMHVQAAFTPTVSNEEKDKIFYGDKNGIRVSQDGSHLIKKLQYGSKRAFFRNGGPDAAASRAGRDYVFKGCQFIERKSWKSWGKAEDLKSVNLPCNIDAAWADGKAMVVLKGDQVWTWGVTGDLYGPWDFNGFYSLIDNWVVQPSVDATADKRGW